MSNFYELAVALLGPLPGEFAFMYPILAFIFALMTASSIIAVLLIPYALLKR